MLVAILLWISKAKRFYKVVNKQNLFLRDLWGYYSNPLLPFSKALKMDLLVFMLKNQHDAPDVFYFLLFMFTQQPYIDFPMRERFIFPSL